MNRNYPSMPPGAIIGYRKNGTPIRLLAGGSEPAVETPAGDPAAPPAPAADSAPPGSQEPAAPATDPDHALKDGDLPAWVHKEMKKLRDENASNRVKAREATDAATAEIVKIRQEQEAQRLAMGKALGLVADEPPTAEALTERLNAAQAKAAAAETAARQSAVELAVFSAAAAAQVNAHALLDSRSFAAKIAGLDPAAGDFAEQVGNVITSAVEANPGWKLGAPAVAAPATPAPPAVPKSTTGTVTGVPDGPRQWTEDDVLRASPAEVQKAMDAGFLQNLGFGTARKNRR